MLEFNNEYSSIPAHTQDALNRYINDRIIPGGFLTAVLSNNLMSAFSKADESNKHALELICKYVYNHLPSRSWGSLEAIHKWTEDTFYDNLRKYQGTEDGV